MKVLGVDYGRRKIGVAVGDTETKFAEPLMVIRYKSIEEGINKVEQVLLVEQAVQVIVGISEGQMAEEIKEFGKKLQSEIHLPVIFNDETLTTQDAQRLSIEAGIKRKKRKNLEDAYAAALMLQSFLETDD